MPIDAAEAKRRLEVYRDDIQFLTIPDRELPAGYRPAKSLPIVVIPGASSMDEAYYRLVSAFVGTGQRVRDRVDAAIITGWTGTGSAEIGVYTLHCKSEAAAKELARPGLIQKGHLLLYIWNDESADAANVVRNHLVEKELR